MSAGFHVLCLLLFFFFFHQGREQTSHNLESIPAGPGLGVLLHFTLVFDRLFLTLLSIAL